MKKMVCALAVLLALLSCNMSGDDSNESDNANLSSLTINTGTLNPAFNPQTTAYSVGVDNTVSSITVTGIAADYNAAVSANSGVAQDLAVGNNTVGITVMAEDGKTEKTYTVTVNRAVATYFITKWKTDNPGASSNMVYFPIVDSGSNDFIIDWGDGSGDHVTSWTDTALSHQYSEAGTYTVTATGIINGFSFSLYEYFGIGMNDAAKLLEISEWGPVKFGNSGYYFKGCENLVVTATDIPDLTDTTSFAFMFSGCNSITDIPNIADWDISEVTDMSTMFGNSGNMNPNIGGWNVSSVINMSYMFQYNTAFNRDISGWTVSNVTSMNGMFNGATSFNRDIGGWDVSKVKNMGGWRSNTGTEYGGMFSGATSFNQDLSEWDVSNVTNMHAMFSGATSFDQSLAAWDVRNVKNMVEMFSGVTLSTANYDATLIAWSNLPSLQSDVVFDGGNSLYSAAAAAARQKIIDDYNWTITDGGAAAP